LDESTASEVDWDALRVAYEALGPRRAEQALDDLYRAHGVIPSAWSERVAREIGIAQQVCATHLAASKEKAAARDAERLKARKGGRVTSEYWSDLFGPFALRPYDGLISVPPTPPTPPMPVVRIDPAQVAAVNKAVVSAIEAIKGIKMTSEYDPRLTFGDTPPGAPVPSLAVRVIPDSPRPFFGIHDAADWLRGQLGIMECEAHMGAAVVSTKEGVVVIEGLGAQSKIVEKVGRYVATMPPERVLRITKAARVRLTWLVDHFGDSDAGRTEVEVLATLLGLDNMIRWTES
jgi:hypothetical protein